LKTYSQSSKGHFTKRNSQTLLQWVMIEFIERSVLPHFCGHSNVAAS